MITAAQAAILGGVTISLLLPSGQTRRSGEMATSRLQLAAALMTMVLVAGAAAATYGLAHRSRWGRPAAVAALSLIGLDAITMLADQALLAIVGTVASVAGIIFVARGTTTGATTGTATATTTGATTADTAPDTTTTTTTTENRPDSFRSIGVISTGVTATIVVAAVLVRSQLLFGLILLAMFFVPIERLLALRPHQKTFRAGWGNDVIHFLVNNMITLAMTVAGSVVMLVALRGLVRPNFQALVLAQPWPLQLIEALVIADLAGYAIHRAHHQIGWLWKFHAVHHSIQEMDWLAAARLHPLNQALDRVVVVVPLFAFGFSRATLGAFVVVFQLEALFIHANVRMRFGPLRWVFATPEFHHWHHAHEQTALDTNFAGQFPWLDRVFGTLHMPKGRMPASYGCDEPVSEHWLTQMAFPFRSRRC